jgi:hypothetical protein
MSESHYCQYAFIRSDCRWPPIGAGVDSRFEIELVREGAVAAVASRVGLDRFDPSRLQGNTAEDVRWLSQIAARHDDIIRRASAAATVLPLRLGTLFQSLASLRNTLVRQQMRISALLDRLDDRREWTAKLYRETFPDGDTSLHAVPPPPHFPLGARTGTEYLARKRSQLEDRQAARAAGQQTVHAIQGRLAAKAEDWRTIRTLSKQLTGRSEEMLSNSAFLVHRAAQESWLAEAERARQDVRSGGLLLELSGPWPPYHFCGDLKG